MAYSELLKRRGFGETSRRDRWWVQPLLIAAALGTFVVYATWAGIQGAHYIYTGGGAEYLSPFYSPLLYGQEGEPRWIAATHPSWWPSWLPFSSAFLILAGPVGIRVTCYYYRGNYYKSFWADPPACAVGEPRKSYLGENSLPLILQNLHRYFFYIAIFLVVVLSYDALRSFWFHGADEKLHFGVGVGSLVLLVNAVGIGGYTFGCHCSRHLFGGRKDCLSKAAVSKACYDCVSTLNRGHMRWAWFSMVWVGFADVYIRLCSMGIWTDWRIL